MSRSQQHQDRVRTRDPERTRAQILESAIEEFAAHGYHGAKIGQICANAQCNARLIYHYFGNKEELYVAVLEHSYAHIRAREQQLDLDASDPVEAMRALVEFTFDFFEGESTFVKITRNENLLGGQFISKTPKIQKMSRPLLSRIDAVLQRGLETGAFSQKVDPLQLYITIVSLSAHHLNSTHTLSATFGIDLSDPAWRAERRVHVVAFVLQALGTTESPR